MQMMSQVGSRLKTLVVYHSEYDDVKLFVLQANLAQ